MKHLLILIFVLLMGGLTISTAVFACINENDSEEKNFSHCLVQAEKGNADAQYRIAKMYWLGTGVNKDYDEAVYWSRKSGQQDYAAGKNLLGVLYKNGHGVERDHKKAIELYTDAAKFGLANAQMNLGLAYYRGVGVTQDYNEAIKWFREAARQGLAGAQLALGVAYKEGQGVAKDYEKAFEWYKEAAEQGLAAAQFALGNAYYNGIGIAQNHEQAVMWLKKAAEQGDVNAQSNLNYIEKSDAINRENVARGIEKRKKYTSKNALTVRDVNLLLTPEEIEYIVLSHGFQRKSNRNIKCNSGNIDYEGIRIHCKNNQVETMTIYCAFTNSCDMRVEEFAQAFVDSVEGIDSLEYVEEASFIVPYFPINALRGRATTGESVIVEGVGSGGPTLYIKRGMLGAEGPKF